MQFIKKIFSKNAKGLSAADEIFFEDIKKIIGFAPKNLEHYQKAFTHRSLNKVDLGGNPVSYERLEFLGDSMLSSIVASFLYLHVPGGDEGYLTKMRSKIVSRKNLNELGKSMNLLRFVDSKVNKKHFGENIYGNIFEALVGAIYLDLGYAFCEKFIQERVVNLKNDIEKIEGKVISYKSLIIEWCQKEKKFIEFDTFADDHIKGEKLFSVHLKIDGKVVAKARETSKKKAEEKAANRAFFAFQHKIQKRI
jgi:ribonuclease III